MNYSVEDILARLQNGEDANIIANEFTDALNNALQKQKEIDEEKNAAKLKEQEHDAKVADMIGIIERIIAYIKHYYPDLTDLIDDAELLGDTDAIVDLIDSTIDEVSALAELASVLKTKEKQGETNTKKTIKLDPQKTASFTAKNAQFNEDAIVKFLKSNGLL